MLLPAPVSTLGTLQEGRAILAQGPSPGIGWARVQEASGMGWKEVATWSEKQQGVSCAVLCLVCAVLCLVCAGRCAEQLPRVS